VEPLPPVSHAPAQSRFRSLGIALRGPGLAALLAVTPDGIAAQDTGPGAVPRVVDLAGARDRPGLFTQRLFLPANFCGPVHIHDRDLHGLVLRGILRMGIADTTGRLDVREYSAGNFVVVPSGRRHVEGSPVETEIHLSGIGPVETTVVDSAAPGRCVPHRGT
jgi:hypothetical protein